MTISYQASWNSLLFKPDYVPGHEMNHFFTMYHNVTCINLKIWDISWKTMKFGTHSGRFWKCPEFCTKSRIRDELVTVFIAVILLNTPCTPLLFLNIQNTCLFSFLLDRNAPARLIATYLQKKLFHNSGHFLTSMLNTRNR